MLPAAGGVEACRMEQAQWSCRSTGAGGRKSAPGVPHVVLPLSSIVAMAAGNTGRAWLHPGQLRLLARLRTLCACASTTGPQYHAKRSAHAQARTHPVSRGVIRSSARTPPSLGTCASRSTALVVASAGVVVVAYHQDRLRTRAETVRAGRPVRCADIMLRAYSGRRGSPPLL